MLKKFSVVGGGLFEFSVSQSPKSLRTLVLDLDLALALALDLGLLLENLRARRIQIEMR